MSGSERNYQSFIRSPELQALDGGARVGIDPIIDERYPLFAQDLSFVAVSRVFGARRNKKGEVDLLTSMIFVNR